MTDAEQREAARQFVNRWMGKGKEDEDGRSYWIDLLTNVLGMDNVTERLNFEKKVVIDGNTKRIDVYIPETRVIIEQKSLGKALDQKIRNSGDVDLTPFEQADRYNGKLTFDERARWIVTSNFAEIWIYDMNQKQPEPTKIALDELQSKYPLLDFLVKKEVKTISHEMEVSIKAGGIVGLIYDAFLKQYRIPDIKEKDETLEQREKREHKLKSLNALCVRIVFCLYAEDAGIFGKRNMFHDYLETYEVKDCRRAIIELFKILDTPVSERDEYLEEELAQFPYVNGGLFADETIEIPPFTEKIKELLLTKASEDFDWSDISPTIFGAVFESTLNPETRRSGGMHYTSIENIHKVISPLFLEDLQKEFDSIRAIQVKRTRDKKLEEFQNKLASLTFFDPACGSGNFLTETYLSLRRLENEVIKEKVGGQMTLVEVNNPIRVSIQQFYGIEINDFAVTVAKTALWIAESQMLEETKNIVYGFNDDFLPLKTYVNITEGNALRIDWNDVIPAEKLSFIMGNPPFVGARWMASEQKEDVEKILCNVPEIALGGQAIDGGFLILTEEEKEEFLEKEPQASPFFRHYMMGKDFIDRKPRYCIWLVGADPGLLKKCPMILERVNKVREFRLSSTRANTKKAAENPTLFASILEHKNQYIAIPKVSSQNRRYIPMDYLDGEIIPGDKLFTMPNASFYEFGVLMSNVHMAWMRAVCGRLKSDYSYSNTIVYNNFPWPVVTEKNREQIEKSAQEILKARTLYPSSNLAALYDPLTMPAELRRAHTANDKAVMAAYGFSTKMTEADCVGELMKLYQKMQ